MFLSGIKMGVNVVCTLILSGKHPWSITAKTRSDRDKLCHFWSKMKSQESQNKLCHSIDSYLVH